jgi:hypothetical protein
VHVCVCACVSIYKYGFFHLRRTMSSQSSAISSFTAGQSPGSSLDALFHRQGPSHAHRVRPSLVMLRGPACSALDLRGDAWSGALERDALTRQRPAGRAEQWVRRAFAWNAVVRLRVSHPACLRFRPLVCNSSCEGSPGKLTPSSSPAVDLSSDLAHVEASVWR